MNAPVPVPWWKRTYKLVSDHVGKILAVAGVGVSAAMIVITDNAAMIEEGARKYLPGRWLHYIGLALFLLLLVRVTWTGMQNTKLKQALEDAKKQ
jgi:hypothetical protein